MSVVTYTLADQKHIGIPGDLMLAIMGALWRAERPLSVTAIQRIACEHYKPVALTTVSSTLARLIRHGWVCKPRPMVYQAKLSRRDVAADVSDKLAALIDTVVLAIEEV